MDNIVSLSIYYHIVIYNKLTKEYQFMLAINALFIQIFLIYGLIFIYRQFIAQDTTKILLLMIASFILTISNQVFVWDFSSIDAVYYLYYQTFGQPLLTENIYYKIQEYDDYIQIIGYALSTLLVLLPLRVVIKHVFVNNTSNTQQLPSSKLNGLLLATCFLPVIMHWLQPSQFILSRTDMIITTMQLTLLVALSIYFYYAVAPHHEYSAKFGFWGTVLALSLTANYIYIIDNILKFGFTLLIGYSSTIFKIITISTMLVTFLLAFRLFRIVTVR